MRNLRQLLRRSGWLSSESRRSRDDQARRGDKNRRLKGESLERRQLLAGDIALAHNYSMATDVDQNQAVTAADALAVINFMNSHGSGVAINADSPINAKVDVNADNFVTASDALAVINALNLGESEGERVELLLNPRKTSDALLDAGTGARDFTVNVGETFYLELSYNDFRTFGADKGAFQISADISLSESGALVPLLLESQTLEISGNIRSATGGSLTFTLAGESGSYTSPIGAFGSNPAAEISNALVALGYTADQFRIFNQSSGATAQNPTPALIYAIRFVDLNLANTDLPNLVVTNNLTGSATPVTVTNTTISPVTGTGEINGAALFGSLDVRSRTFNSNGPNASFYTLRQFGAFDPSATTDAFNEVGAIGQTTDIPATDSRQILEEPFDAFSIPVRFVRPVSNFQISLNPAENDEAILLYGEASTEAAKVTPEQTLIGANAAFTVTAIGVGTVPTVSVAVAPAAVNEDGTGALVYTFTRSGATTDPLTVNYSVSGTATSGTDFAALSGSLTIPAGQTSATVSVNPTDDTTVEPDETIILTVTDAAAYDLGTPSVATGTITNDDVAAGTPTVSVAVAPAAVNEDGAGALVYTFTRSGATTDPLTVNYSVSGTATSGTDFAALSGSLTIPAGQTSATVSVNPSDDTTVEPDETIILTVTDAAAYDLGTPSVATGTITNDDVAAGTPTVSVAVAPAAVNVDGSGTLVYTFTRSGATTDPLTVNYSVSGTATSGTDFAALSGSLTIAAGQTSATVSVNPNDDTTVEPDETIILTVTDAAAYDLGTPSVATGTITNDDVAPSTPTVSVAVAPAAVNENGAGTLVYTFTRTGATTNPLTVNYSVSGTATSGTDFAALSGSLTIPAGQASATVSVNPTDDTTVEPNETIILTVTDAAAYDVGTPGNATGTITNDDQPPVNVPPVVSGPVTRTVTEDDAPTTVNLLTNASDPNAGDVLAVSNVVVASGDARGIVLSGNSLNVTPSAYSFLVGGQSTVVYNYNVTDGQGGVTPATATITITGINDAPVATNDSNLTAFAGTTTRLNVLANDNAGGGETQVITVTSATITSGNATVAPTADGSAVSLTVPAGATGTVTFNYTIRDAGGLTATASASVTVQNFNPSTISGSVFYDKIENVMEIINGATPVRDGVQDSDEAGLGGLAIRLESAASANSTNQAISRTVFTELDGSYEFTNLPPGTYTVSYATPDTVIAGRDINGSASGDGVANGVMTVVIASPGGTSSSATGRNFTLFGNRNTGEAGSGLDYLDLLTTSYLSANQDIMEASDGGAQGGTVSLSESGTQNFFSAAEGFDGVKFAEFTLNATGDAALLTIIGADNVARTARLDSRHFVASKDGKSVRFFGGQEDFNFVSSDTALVQQEFANYRNLVDQIMNSIT